MMISSGNVWKVTEEKNCVLFTESIETVTPCSDSFACVGYLRHLVVSEVNQKRAEKVQMLNMCKYINSR